MQHLHELAILPLNIIGHARGLVRGTVIHDDDLDGAVALAEHALDSLSKHSRAIEYRDDRADEFFTKHSKDTLDEIDKAFSHGENYLRGADLDTDNRAAMCSIGPIVDIAP